MNKLHLLIICFWFFQPNIAKAKPVKGISDFDGGFKGVEKITFECPVNNERNIRKTNDEFDDQQLEEKCWVDFCLLYTSPSPRDRTRSRMPSSA